MSVNAIFEISDEHKMLAAFSISDGGQLDVLGLGYRRPDGKLEAKYRNRYLSGRKDAFNLRLASDSTESDVVDKLSDIFTRICRDFPDTKGRLLGPSEISRLSTGELLAFLMRPFHDEEEQKLSCSDWSDDGL